MNNKYNDEQIAMYQYRIIVQVSKISLNISIAIMLISVISTYSNYISLQEWKIAAAFIEAKIAGLFNPEYRISYPCKYAITIKKEIAYFLNDPYVTQTLAKFQFVLYESLKLTGKLHLLIFGSMVFCLWLRKMVISDNPYPKIIQGSVDSKLQAAEPLNKIKSISSSSIKKDHDEFIKVKNI